MSQVVWKQQTHTIWLGPDPDNATACGARRALRNDITATIEPWLMQCAQYGVPVTVKQSKIMKGTLENPKNKYQQLLVPWTRTVTLYLESEADLALLELFL